MAWMPTLPEYGGEIYASFPLPEGALQSVQPAEALRADTAAKQRTGIAGFADPRFWVALVCYCAAMPLFFAAGASWGAFQIVMPFFIAFIVVATVAWDFRLIGDPNKLHNLVLHALLTVALVFLLNRLLSMGDAVPPAEAAAEAEGWMARLWSAGVAWVSSAPYVSWMVRLGEFLLQWIGYAVILFFVSGAVIFPQRVAVALLFVFGLIFVAISVGRNLSPSLWSLGLGLLLMVAAFVLQRGDDRRSRFWEYVTDRLRRSPALPSVNMDIKLDLLRLLYAEKEVSRERFRGVVAGRLGVRSDDPRVNSICVAVADQLATQDGLAESREGSGGWRFVLAVPEEASDFFASTARVVRIALTLGFSTVYILSPIDLMPDATPVFGVVDDMLLGAVALVSAIRKVG